MMWKFVETQGDTAIYCCSECNSEISVKHGEELPYCKHCEGEPDGEQFAKMETKMDEYINRKDLIAEYDRVHVGAPGGARKLMVEAPAVNVVKIPDGGIGDLSDGYHTFNELYHHRAVLFSVICNSNPEKAWKSKLHDTGDMFEEMFIVGIETPQGQATYHYALDPYWEMFDVKELPNAPKWDGHTAQQAIERIGMLYTKKGI